MGRRKCKWEGEKNDEGNGKTQFELFGNYKKQRGSQRDVEA